MRWIEENTMQNLKICIDGKFVSLIKRRIWHRRESLTAWLKQDGGTWRQMWERLKAAESNGNLPLRNFPRMQRAEPYRSPD